MADGKIEIDTSIDTKGADVGIKNLTSKLKTFGKMSGVVAGVTTAVKTFNKVVKDTSQAYRTQERAEKQLEASAKNNPYLNSSSVKALKEYASYLQSISTVGDEQLIPMMSQLASAGRTQTEIQDIMSTALDVSATGMMSLDSAVQSLNASYSGNVGMLGRQISELKGLTKEELASGKAVQIVAEKFKGVSEEVSKVTGTSEQLKNAWGDLKEEIGYSFEKNMKPMRSFFTELIQGWSDARKKRREYEGYVEQNEAGKGTVVSLQAQVDRETELLNGMAERTENARKLLEKSDKELKKTNEYGQFTEWSDSANPLQDFKNEQQAIIDNYETQAQKVADLNDKLAEQKEIEKTIANQEEADEKMQERERLRAVYDATIEQALKEIELRRSLGEEISKQDEAQQMLNVSTDAYVKMMSDPAFEGNNGTYSHEVNARSQIAQWMEDAKDVPEVADALEELKQKLQEITETEKEAKQQEINLLDAEYEKLNAEQKLEVMEQYKEARLKLFQELKEIGDAEVQAQKEQMAEMFTNVNDFVSQFGNISNQMTSMLTEANKTQTSSELAKLEEQYSQGLTSYEDYCKKKEEINKKSAYEQYKINMWTWTASLLEATSNIAQGVSKALTGQAPMSFINAGLVATAGAMQIASITASKPIRPSFATGGIVQGSSYRGDNVLANVNSGEMILNASQQKALWNMANGSGGGGSVVNMPVTIENNNGSNVQTQMDSNGLRIIVDNIVNAGMQSGRYTQSMNVANNKSKGVRYL